MKCTDIKTATCVVGRTLLTNMCHYFGCEMPSRLIKNKFDKFILIYNCVEDIFCKYCCVIT